MRGTLGEYIAYKSYIVRKREHAPRPDTQNKIKKFLFTYCRPTPILRNILCCLWARAGRGHAPSGQQCAHAGGGGGAQRGRQEGRQKRRAGKKKNSDITINALLSLMNHPPGIELQCSAAQEDHTMKGIARQESPALWNCPPNHSIFRIRKGG